LAAAAVVPPLDARAMTPLKVAVLFGTRPEAIKMAPVVRQLRAATDMTVEIVLTAQHREMLDQVLALFGIEGDHDLDVMRPRQTLAELSSRLLAALDGWLAASKPDLLLVQGDTTSVCIGALAAFYRGVPTGHVEAGLRTPSPLNPFPEEMNRRLVSRLALLHFAPTERSRTALLAEGIDDDARVVTGNTVVDALNEIRRTPEYARAAVPVAVGPGEKLVLVTMHRRESWDRIASVCAAIAAVVDARPDVRVAFPVHPNPAVHEPVHQLLAGVPRVELIAPLEYLAFIKLMAMSRVILTDSGGVQEEAPVLGRPVLVLREMTERAEAISAGVARLVGTDRDAIVSAVLPLIDDDAAWAAMSKVVSPFGDGFAAERIVESIGRHRAAILDYAGRVGNPRRGEAKPVAAEQAR
jgi:UDP-N-acetylglucosamine 2-epimerase (non-hydrolysing)